MCILLIYYLHFFLFFSVSLTAFSLSFPLSCFYFYFISVCLSVPSSMCHNCGSYFFLFISSSPSLLIAVSSCGLLQEVSWGRLELDERFEVGGLAYGSSVAWSHRVLSQTVNCTLPCMSPSLPTPSFTASYTHTNHHHLHAVTKSPHHLATIITFTMRLTITRPHHHVHHIHVSLKPSPSILNPMQHYQSSPSPILIITTTCSTSHYRQSVGA